MLNNLKNLEKEKKKLNKEIELLMVEPTSSTKENKQLKEEMIREQLVATNVHFHKLLEHM